MVHAHFSSSAGKSERSDGKKKNKREKAKAVRKPWAMRECGEEAK